MLNEFTFYIILKDKIFNSANLISIRLNLNRANFTLTLFPFYNPCLVLFNKYFLTLCHQNFNQKIVKIYFMLNYFILIEIFCWKEIQKVEETTDRHRFYIIKLIT